LDQVEDTPVPTPHTRGGQLCEAHTAHRKGSEGTLIRSATVERSSGDELDYAFGDPVREFGIDEPLWLEHPEKPAIGEGSARDGSATSSRPLM